MKRLSTQWLICLLSVMSGVVAAQATSPRTATKSIDFDITTETLATSNYDLPGDQLGVYNAVEATISVADVDCNGTATVVLASMLDDGVTTSTVFSKQIVFTGDETAKIQAVRTFGESPVYFGRTHQLRVSVIGDAADSLTVATRLYYVFN